MAGWKREFRQALPVSDRGVAPPPRFQRLPVEIGADGREALRVDEWPERHPCTPVGFDLRNATVVVLDEGVPQRAAVTHAIGPRHVMEEQEILVGNALQ